MTNLSPEEREYLRTKEGAFAVIMGYLKAERGKIAPSVFNKLVTELGYEKQNKADLLALAELVAESGVLRKLYLKGFNREIKLDDIPNVNEEPALAETDLFQQVTSYLIAHEDNNARLRELRKLQREGVYMKLLVDNLKKHLVEELKGMPRAKYLQTTIPEPPQPGDKSLILMLADWHVGALVYNEATGGYNFTKLQGQVQDILKRTLGIIRSYGIKHVYVFHLGDAIEHVTMRNVNQAFDAEFPATEQIAKAGRLITDVLISLSKEVHVTFGIVAGNHDRFQGNKNDKVYNDNAAYLILDNLFHLQETFGQLPNVTLIDNRKDTYEFVIKVAGKNVKVKHGDHEKKSDTRKIPKHIKDEPIDFLLMGHVHTTAITQEDYSRFQVYVASTMGANSYSSENNFPTTSAAQMIMILEEGSNTPVFIPLMV